MTLCFLAHLWLTLLCTDEREKKPLPRWMAIFTQYFISFTRIESNISLILVVVATNATTQGYIASRLRIDPQHLILINVPP
jgi:hypothetical protein